MTDSLRDQLLGLGFKPAPKPERRNDAPQGQRRQGDGGRPRGDRPQQPGAGRGGPRPAGRPASGAQGTPDGRRQGQGSGNGRGQGQGQNQGQAQGQKRPQGGGGRGRGAEMDLGKAFALRAQQEKEERIEAERLKQEEARKRREAKAKLEELLKDKGLNDPAADIARHFPYGGKIKRIYVNQDQLRQLNAAELGVVQMNGRYLLVTAEVLAEAEAVFAPSVALKVDPDAPVSEDPYADPKFVVPDDLVW